MNKLESKITFHEKKMVIPNGADIVVRYYEELMYVIFDKPYCLLYFFGNSRYRVEISLKYMMEKLPENTFIQCKRSSILNINYFKEFKRRERIVTMVDGSEIKLSKRNLPEFIWKLNNMPRISPTCPNCGNFL